MELKIKDRLLIKRFIPEKGDIFKLKIAKSIIEKIDLTLEEITEAEIKQTADGKIAWNPSKDTGKDIQLEKAEIEILKEQVEEQSKAKTLDLDVLDLALKIKEQ